MTTANRVVPDRHGLINIGKIKENLVTEVELPAPGFAGGSYAVLLQRPREKQPYPVTARTDGGRLIWTVQTADTAIPGTGKLECRWYGDSGEVAKSQTYMVRITDGLPDPTEAPEAYAGYVAQVTRNAEAAKSAASVAGAAAGRAETALKALEDGITSGDFRGEKGEKGDTGPKGEKGDKGDQGPAGDTTAANDAAKAAQSAAEASAGSAASAAESVGGLADDLEATQKDIAKMKRAIQFQAELNKGQTWDFEEDTQEAYQRQVPSGAKAGAVMEWGGKTVWWNQLQKPRATTRFGITETVNADGTVNLSGEFTDSSGYGWFRVGGTVHFNRIDQHIYLGIAPKNFDRSFGVSGYGTLSTEGSNLFVWKAPKHTNNWNDSLCIAATNGDVIEYRNIRFAVIDLTILYGPGNEPADTTDPRIAQIEAYAAANPEYNAGELVNALVDEVRVRGKNLVNVDAAEIQGVSNVSISGDDIIVKKNSFVKFPLTLAVGDVVSVSFGVAADFSNAEIDFLLDDGEKIILWGVYTGAVEDSKKTISRTISKNVVAIYIQSWANANNVKVSNLQVELFDTPTAYSPYRLETYPIPDAIRNLPGYGWSAGSVANTIERTENGWQYVQRVGSRAYQEGDELTDRTTTYYALATPITTDITALMGNSLAPFAVEAGGSIILHHPKADEGFAIDVPTKIQYITKLSEVSANG